MTGSDVTVVIVNWNSGGQLAACLASLQRNGGDRLGRVIVVDNSSTDESLKTARAIDSIRVLQSDENLGFGRACNLGASQVDDGFLLFLNPDTTVHPGTVDYVVAFMERPENSRVGICGVQLIDDRGVVARSCARFPSLLAFCLSSLGLNRFFPSQGVLMDDWAHDRSVDVDHVIGAFYFVRTELFRTLQGFDERFFIYLEDLDFSLRTRRLGWRCVYLAEVRAFHAGGGTSNQIKDRRLFYALRSRIVFVFKHFSGRSAWIVMLMTVFIEPLVRLTWALGQLSLSSFAATWRGYVMLWRWLPEWAFRGITR